MQKYQIMKELLQQYSAYNLWANKILLQAISELTDDQINKEITSSFSSILKTLIHMLDTESIWWQRLKLSENIDIPSADKSLTFSDISNKLIQSSNNWADWVKQANEVNINHVFEYRNSKKELFKQPVSEVIMQVVNHQTYHRGQLVTMMRQAGVTKIPGTDYVLFCRKK